jgi:hypothetical protein
MKEILLSALARIFLKNNKQIAFCGGVLQSYVIYDENRAIDCHRVMLVSFSRHIILLWYYPTTIIQLVHLDPTWDVFSGFPMYHEKENTPTE